ncbi:MAG TPA: hypothetical protein VMV95_02725 [Bacillota bacterium]|nr:hypothetical protein [Bacillota bacterium]
MNSASVISHESSEEGIILGIKIMDFESPVKLGDFSYFKYSIETNLGEITDVLINFEIEKDDKIISSGSDMALIGEGAIIEETKIFLPSNLESGVYTLRIRANYGDYQVESFRVIELRVRGGSAIINNNNGIFKFYSMILLIILFIFIFGFLIYLERKKIEEVLIEERKFIKKHRQPILIVLLFLILGALFYFFDLYYYLPDIPFYFYLIFLILTVGILLLLKFSKKKKKIKKGKKLL